MSLIHCNLRVLMAERGLNIQKVKDQTTLSRTTISNLYNNFGSGIQFGTLLELCELLKCQPGDLLTYIEVVPNFEVLSEKPELLIEEDTHTVDEDGNGYDYVSSIKTDLNLYCLLRYEGRKYDFTFKVEVKYGIDENKHVNKLDLGTSADFEDSLNGLKLPPHVIDHIDEELCNFLIDWGHDYFSGEEIEGITHMTINRQTLQR